MAFGETVVSKIWERRPYKNDCDREEVAIF